MLCQPNKKQKKLIASDYYKAAMIFQHAPPRQQKRAITLAKKSMNMGYVKAKWLYMAAIDRALLASGEKQKFGTQFKVLKNNKEVR